jgi:hypothetical protein
VGSSYASGSLVVLADIPPGLPVLTSEASGGASAPPTCYGGTVPLEGLRSVRERPVGR